MSRTTMSSYDFETGDTTLNVPLMDPSQRLRSALGFAAAAARRRFPQSGGRIDAASRLILDGKVVLHQDRTASVQSEKSDTVYRVNGHCECPDAARAPEGFCKHRLSVAISKKAMKLVEEWHAAAAPVVVPPQEVETDEPIITSPEEPEQESGTIPAHFLYKAHGKVAIYYAGLLDLSHRQGLLSLREITTHVSDTYVMAKAIAEFSDGRVFEAVGDSSPDNVGKTIQPHWRRMAGTRAKARALRDALNLSYVSVEELAD